MNEAMGEELLEAGGIHMRSWNKIIDITKAAQMSKWGVEEEEAEAAGWWNVRAIDFLWKELPMARLSFDGESVAMELPPRLEEVRLKEVREKEEEEEERRKENQEWEKEWENV